MVEPNGESVYIPSKTKEDVVPAGLLVHLHHTVIDSVFPAMVLLTTSSPHRTQSAVTLATWHAKVDG